MNKIIHLLIPVVLVLLLSGCEKPPRMLKPAGPDALQIRQCSPASVLVLYDAIDVVFSDSVPRGEIWLRGGIYLLDWVITEHTGDSLVISNDNRGNWIRSYAKIPELKMNPSGIISVQYFSAGTLSCESAVYTDTLTVDLRKGGGSVFLTVEVTTLRLSNLGGTTDVHIDGNAFLSYIFNSCYGPIFADELNCQQVYMNNDGFSDVHARAQRIFASQINNSGNVYYYGTPEQLTLNCFGLGKYYHVPD
ncbi:MAG: hypothetical protein EOL88_05315 [Bacteroidia bacterium]|nr:hypothetical protein [Bacteroidia bacterium]